MQRNPNLPSALTETQTKPSPGRCPPGTPTRRQALGRLPTPPPLPENLLSDCTENCPLCPLRAPRRVRNPKIGQQLGAQPTPRFRGMIEAMTEAMIDVEFVVEIEPSHPLTF